MSRIALLGATSQIARDLAERLAATHRHQLFLYARRPEAVNQWRDTNGIVEATAAPFTAFGQSDYDAVINFVGVGDPAKAVTMAASIFEVTLEFEQLALGYIAKHPHCRYLFLSSGAAYGSDFTSPATRETRATIPANNLLPQDYYGAAKLAAECHHRTLSTLPIIDIRVFNYFSRTQDLDARFFITDMVRALRSRDIFYTSRATMTRDYLHPDDFYRLVTALLTAPPANAVVDAYSRAPIDKFVLLDEMRRLYDLKVELADVQTVSVNATGAKPHYYSTNDHAATFGYTPHYTSLDGLKQEIQAIMDAVDA